MTSSWVDPTPLPVILPRKNDDTGNWIENFKVKMRQMNLCSEETRRRSHVSVRWLGVLSWNCWDAAVTSGHGHNRPRRQIRTLRMEGVMLYMGMLWSGTSIRWSRKGVGRMSSELRDNSDSWGRCDLTHRVVLMIISYLTGHAHLSSYIMHVVHKTLNINFLQGTVKCGPSCSCYGAWEQEGYLSNCECL